jgi:hypothetical protein
VPERAEHDALVRLVERILSAKRAALDADTTALEREIDSPREIGRDSRADPGLGRLISRGERVYRLYLPAPACASHADRPRLRQAGGLTADEIKLVESAFAPAAARQGTAAT